jgi:hypothetical protein
MSTYPDPLMCIGLLHIMIGTDGSTLIRLILLLNHRRSLDLPIFEKF